MSQLENYEIGGTIHFIVNNQIGFTTTPKEDRTGLYCSELAKSVQAPIFHVNADDVESVVKVCKIAAEYKMKFKKDVVIDIIGYRKFGHNELDQPSFTQPLMYKKIKNHPNVREIYKQQLIKEGTVDDQWIKDLEKRVWDEMEESYIKSKNQKINYEEWKDKPWEEIKDWRGEPGQERITGVEINQVRELG